MMKLTIDGFNNIEKNKYYSWYQSIILNRLTQKPSLDIYCEKHHILPRCIGGTNAANNVVLVTGREHFLLHLLLTKFITGKKNALKMLCAFNSMCMKSKYHKERYIKNSKMYQNMRIKSGRLLAQNTKELWNNPEYREKMKRLFKKAWEEHPNRAPQRKYMIDNSPWKNKETHKKTIDKRAQNRSNVFVTNNPMLNEELKKKKVLKTSGANSYLVKKYNYSYSTDSGASWILLPPDMTVDMICKKMGWKVSTFNYILYRNRIPGRGNMKGIHIKQELSHEN